MYGNGCGYSTVLLCHRLVVGDCYTREGTHYAPALNYGYIATGVGALHGGEMVTHTEQKTVSSLRQDSFLNEGSIPSTSTIKVYW